MSESYWLQLAGTAARGMSATWSVLVCTVAAAAVSFGRSVVAVSAKPPADSPEVVAPWHDASGVSDGAFTTSGEGLPDD